MTLAMSWDEWATHDAVALADRVRSGELTPAELAAQVAAGIAKLNPALDAVIEVFDDVVADPLRDGMNANGAFAGVPYLMKDLGPTLKGRLQEFGSRMMQGFRPAQDSFLTAKIRNAGLNIIGRSTTPEFGVCSAAENALCVTRNPWDTAYTTNGSSAGSSAMIAAGVLPIAHATDGGGSIRIPAAATGSLGLKVSRGVFSLAPNLSDLSGLVSIQGCISRSVRDTATFVDQCRGGAPGEFMPFWSPAESYSELIKRDPGRLRIALSHEWGDFSATPHFVAELERVGKLLEGLGHHVEWGLPEVDFRAAFAAQTTCYNQQFFAGHLPASWLGSASSGRPPELLEPINILLWEAGREYLLHRAQRHAGGVQHHVARLRRFLHALGHHPDADHRKADAKNRHHRISHQQRPIPSVHDWFANLWQNFAYTPLANLCGLPGISLPLAAQENGLPLGIQAQAAQANDGLLLQLAAQIERAIGGKWNDGKRPTEHVSRN